MPVCSDHAATNGIHARLPCAIVRVRSVPLHPAYRGLAGAEVGCAAGAARALAIVAGELLLGRRVRDIARAVPIALELERGVVWVGNLVALHQQKGRIKASGLGGPPARAALQSRAFVVG